MHDHFLLSRHFLDGPSESGARTLRVTMYQNITTNTSHVEENIKTWRSTAGKCYWTVCLNHHLWLVNCERARFHSIAVTLGWNSDVWFSTYLICGLNSNTNAFYNNNDAMKDLKSSAKPFNKQTHRLKKNFTFLSPRVCIRSSTSNQVST